MRKFLIDIFPSNIFLNIALKERKSKLSGRIAATGTNRLTLIGSNSWSPKVNATVYCADLNGRGGGGGGG